MRSIRILALIAGIAILVDARYGSDFFRIMLRANVLMEGEHFKELVKKQAKDISEMSPRERALTKIQFALIRSMAGDGNSAPKSLSELVPKYLDSVPLDPENGKPFFYQTTPTGYELR